MKKLLLIGLAMLALFGSTGCMVISCEEHRRPPHRHVARTGPCRIVEGIHIVHP